MWAKFGKLSCIVCSGVLCVLWCVCVVVVLWRCGVSIQNPMCRFKTCPYVRLKRFRVCRQNARTCARGAGTHGDVLNVNTGTFRIDTRGF